MIVTVQAAVHLALLPVGGWIGDTRLLQTWAVQLSKGPVSTFYASQKRADHLPGDLWILRLEAAAYRLASGHSPSNAGFLKALKLGPGIADIGIAIVLFLIAREIQGARAGRRAALFFALNPAPYFISMVWGVADSVSFFFAALALLFTIRRWFWAAMPALAYACLVKPQLGLLAPLLLIFYLHYALKRDRRWPRTGLELGAAAAGSVGVLLAALTPFDVGPPFTHERWPLAERIKFSASLYKSTTLNAFNLWAFVSAKSLDFPGDGAPSDQRDWLLKITYQHWAIVLTAIACVILSLPLIHKGGAERLVWTAAAVSFAFFMLQTRIHERYFFPAVALMALAVALRPRFALFYVVMSAVYFANVWWVYHWLGRPRAERGGIGGFAHLPGVHVGPSRAGGMNPGVVSAGELRALVGVNLAVLGFFVVHAILDYRKSSPAGALTAIAAPADPQSPYLDTDWSVVRERRTQHPI